MYFSSNLMVMMCLNLIAHLFSIRFKFEVQAVDNKYKVKFVFWDSDYVKMIEKTILEFKNELSEVIAYNYPNILLITCNSVYIPIFCIILGW